MAHATKHLEALLRLPRDERAAAAEALLESLETEEQADPGSESAWAEEIQRRIEMNEPAIPAEQVFAEGREKLKDRT